MSRGIPVTSRRGVQAVALVFAGALVLSAYFFATTGWGTPFRGCWPELSSSHALTLAVLEVALATGFAVASLRDPRGPRLEDPFLIGLVLAAFAVFAINGGAYTLWTGVARYGRSGCLHVEAPLSYGIGALACLVGAVALLAAVTMLLRGGHSD